MEGMDQKTIVLTGAMGPLRYGNGHWRNPAQVKTLNDGWKNLALALEDVHQASPGVYVEMGQGPWEADGIRKQVQVDAPGTRTAKVVHSGFVADDPARHRIIPF